MRWLIFAALTLVVLILQTTLVRWLQVGHAAPDLLVVLLIFLALYGDRRNVLLANWFLGLARDLYSDGPLGLYALLFLAVGWFIGSHRDKLFTDHFITHLILGFSATFLCGGVVVTTECLVYGLPEWGKLMGRMAGAAIYTAALSPFLFLLLRFPRRWMRLHLGRAYR